MKPRDTKRRTGGERRAKTRRRVERCEEREAEQRKIIGYAVTDIAPGDDLTVHNFKPANPNEWVLVNGKWFRFPSSSVQILD